MNRALIPVLMAVVLDLVGFGIVIPLLTYYAEEYQAGPMEVTLLMAVYSLAQFLMAPVWGSLSDRFGRRPVMLISLAMGTVCLAGFAWADTLVLLFVFRTLHGAAAANISTAQACVADLTTPEKRAQGMGLIGAAFGVGFTLGPFIGGELSIYGYATPIWVAAGLAAINLVLAIFLLPETRSPETVRAQRTLNPKAFLRVMRHPVVGLCIVLTFVITISFAMMESTFTLFAEHVRALEAQHVGRMFGVTGLVMILVQGGLVGRLVKRFGETRLVPAGLTILVFGLVMLPYAPASWDAQAPKVDVMTPASAEMALNQAEKSGIQATDAETGGPEKVSKESPTDPTFSPLTLIFVIIAIGQGICNPSLHALISRGTSASEQGFVLGTNQSMSALARAVGPAMGGGLLSVAYAMPFLASAVVLAVSVPLSVVAARKWTAEKAA